MRIWEWEWPIILKIQLSAQNVTWKILIFNSPQWEVHLVIIRCGNGLWCIGFIFPQIILHISTRYSFMMTCTINVQLKYAKQLATLLIWHFNLIKVPQCQLKQLPQCWLALDLWIHTRVANRFSISISKDWLLITNFNPFHNIVLEFFSTLCANMQWFFITWTKTSLNSLKLSLQSWRCYTFSTHDHKPPYFPELKARGACHLFFSLSLSLSFPHKWHSAGVKEVPTYSTAKFLLQTVA